MQSFLQNAIETARRVTQEYSTSSGVGLYAKLWLDSLALSDEADRIEEENKNLRASQEELCQLVERLRKERDEAREGATNYRLQAVELKELRDD